MCAAPDSCSQFSCGCCIWINHDWMSVECYSTAVQAISSHGCLNREKSESRWLLLAAARRSDLHHKVCVHTGIFRGLVCINEYQHSRLCFQCYRTSMYWSMCSELERQPYRFWVWMSCVFECSSAANLCVSSEAFREGCSFSALHQLVFFFKPRSCPYTHSQAHPQCN